MSYYSWNIKAHTLCDISYFPLMTFYWESLGLCCWSLWTALCYSCHLLHDWASQTWRCDRLFWRGGCRLCHDNCMYRGRPPAPVGEAFHACFEQTSAVVIYWDAVYLLYNCGKKCRWRVRRLNGEEQEGWCVITALFSPWVHNHFCH